MISLTARDAATCLVLALAAIVPATAEGAEPIAPYPENPRYFVFRDKAAFLITSGEHYGAVLNLDFDFVRYLDELQACRFNLTRLFSGTYREVPGSFQIQANTLAPASGRYLAPWARSNQPGAVDGGNKFDLDAWDPVYFHRLRSFIAAAGVRGVVVEVVLFCPFYEENLWQVNPLHARNNVAGLGNMPRTEVFTLRHPSIVTVQEALVRKLVVELHPFDNLYYEICNEPYFGGVTLDWQARIARVIVQTESKLGGRQHMIAAKYRQWPGENSAPRPGRSAVQLSLRKAPRRDRDQCRLERSHG